MQHKQTLLVHDISNLLHRAYFSNPNHDESTRTGLAQHIAFSMLNKYYKQFSPVHKSILCFDRPSWRKDYTLSDECYSKRIYKGERRKDMTEKQTASYKIFLNYVKEFEEMLRENTGIICLAGEKLEADDLIAGVTHAFSDEYNVVIVSSDKDFLQLLYNDNITLLDPMSGKPRSLEEWNNDSDYFLFEKCFRGEKGASSDNIESAYPRVRATKIQAAYDDSYKREAIMHESWKHIDGRTMQVKKLFNENKLLMGLSHQPDWVKERIAETIAEGFANPGRYNALEFVRYCGKLELKKIVEHVERYSKMLKG